MVMRKIAYFISAVILTGCGGGGSTSSNTNSSTNTNSNTTPPALNISMDKSFARIGDTVTLMWESSNASGCQASGSWSGVMAKTGSQTLILQEPGVNVFYLECTNNSSSVKLSKSIVVPYPVYNNSYENKNNINFNGTQLPTIRALGIKVDADEQDSNERSVTFGDFFQDGKVSAFVVTTRHKNVYNVPNLADSPSKAYFLSKNANGVWEDKTNLLLKNTDDRYNCVTVSYSITSDFNNDKVPDVFLACNGIDYDLGNGTMNYTHPNFRQIYLEHPILYLSMPDKTYKKVQLPYRLYAHQAAAADLNKDGAVDLILTNQVSDQERLPVVLMGNGDGSFYKNDNLLSDTKITNNRNGLYQVQLIPIEGRTDLVLGYADEAVWIKQKSTGDFDFSSWKSIKMPISSYTKNQYVMFLDVVYKNEFFYFTTNSNLKNETEWVIIKTSAANFAMEIIPTFKNSSDNLQPYSAQIKPDNAGNFVAYTGGCNKDLTKGMCSLRIRY